MSRVNGLLLPSLLMTLLAQDRWRHPGDTLIHTLIPCLEGPIELFPSIEAMEQASSWTHWLEEPNLSQRLHIVRGSASSIPIDLPWVDGEQFVVIAGSREYGDDQLIALDYRTSRTDPRVIVCAWYPEPMGCLWIEVTAAFSLFVKQLGL
jgi:hypothetical protein